MSGTDYRYCPYCATPLVERVVYGRTRPVCPACGFTQYPDPKVAVIAFVTQGERLLLIQRAVDPAKGKWSLPGGYMDAGELPAQALQRELLEEVSLAVDVGRLLDIFPMVTAGRRSGIVLAFHAIPMDPTQVTLLCQDDACDAAWFLPAEVPVDLAFESTLALVQRWQQGWQPD
jgi:8-oxo-dGTP diphosphatase